jgi:hypothetical protein
MPVSETSGVVVDQIPLAVITAREPVTDNKWISERWRVVGVVAGSSQDRGKLARTVLRSAPDGEQYLWTGLVLRLRPSEADSYYYNLIGQNPSLYIYCHQESTGEPCPRSITAEYIDALAHGETGNDTHSVPMPPDVYRCIEHYVLEHYVPEEPKMKRKHETQRGMSDDE